MAERRPPGFTVDLAFYDSPEAMSIPRKIRAEAIGVWTLAGSYSANQLTDGHVPAEILRSLGCRPAIRAALMATRNADGTPSPLWIEGESGGILFTRWSKWQRTSDEVRNYRLSESERKKRQRAAIKQAVSSDDEKTSAKRPPGRPHNVRAEDRDPKTETETETETSTSLTLVEGGPGGDPARRETATRTRGTRLPAEWIPTPEVVAQMRSDHPHIDLKAEHAKFLDYWHGRAGKDARKADWNATWRNWIRRASEQSPNGRAHAPPNGIGKPSLKALGYQALADEIIAEMEHE